MAETLGFFTRTDLNSMVNKCFTDKKFKNYLEFEYDLGHGFDKYMSKTALHEAGYDSYITGVVFASLAKQIEIQTFTEYYKQRSTPCIGGSAALEDKKGKPTEGVLSCRTGRDYLVPLPSYKNLVEISNSPISL